jgi:hypothetical protein
MKGYLLEAAMEICAGHGWLFEVEEYGSRGVEPSTI